ncbi:MAG: hypothetical protein LRY50_04400, partial [Geovibrio sp.]|nr:hypothetical protein [Geovibrio sp.]
RNLLSVYSVFNCLMCFINRTMFSDIDAKASGKVSEGMICQINQFTVRKIKINILKVKDG